MHAAAERLAFAPPQTPGSLRALALAVLVHALLLAALAWGVHWRRDAEIVSAEAELWSSVPVEAAPRLQTPPPEPPAPVQPVQAAPPTPAPPPPAPEPPKVDIALQKEKLRLKKLHEQDLARQEQQRLDKLKQERLREEKLKQEKLKQDKRKQDQLKQEQRRQEQLQQEQAAKARQAAEDKKRTEQAAQQLELQRQKNLKRMEGLAGASGGSGATGKALKSAGPSASYAGRIRARVKPNIVFTESINGNPTAEVEVRTAPDGTIVGRKLTQSSGVPAWDDAVLKALDKTEVLPRDIDGTVPSSLLLVFRPKD